MPEATRRAVCRDNGVVMARYEYKVKCFLSNEEKGINKLADEVWELVFSYCLGLYLVFKREKVNN